MAAHSARTSVITLCLVALLSHGAATQRSGGGPPELPDGTPLQGEQFPRFVTPTQRNDFGFNDFLVLGDHSAVGFERHDPGEDAGFSLETWERVTTRELVGRVVSVFRPVWTGDQLRSGLRSQRWGVDRPYLYWGDVVVPDAGSAGRRALYLQIAPPNVPASQVVRASATLQYTSHAVNIWMPGFGDSRIRDGETALDLSAVTQPFYESFVDEYETLAVVSQTALLTRGLGWRQNVRNQIAGIGLDEFDRGKAFGSDAQLQGIEVYPPGGWATSNETLHQQAHQWGDYSRVWDQLGIERQGQAPAIHTPLLSPGAVLAGAVLEGSRRVGTDGLSGFAIERTGPLVTFHPLTLYRMGLIGVEDLPQLRLFQNQGQFDPSGRSAPPVDMVVAGGEIPVFPSDVVAADGERRGPRAARVRRALIYVSRAGLASQAEMDIVNFYAARLAATEGTRSWDGYPSFFEASGGRASLRTDVTPREGLTPEGKIEAGPPVAFLAVDADALAGVALDRAIPGLISVDQTLALTGSVTDDVGQDTNIACFRFIRYGSIDPNEVFVCGSVSGGRFAMNLTFTAAQRGRYTVEPFLFRNDAAEPSATSRYGVVVVD